MTLKEFKNKKQDKNIFLNFHKYKTLKTLYLYIKDKKNINFSDYEIKKILDLLRYDFTEYDLFIRLKQIKSVSKSPSKNSYIIRYGEIEGTKRYESFQKKCGYKGSREYLEEKYKDDPDKVNEILKSRCPNNIETLKKKYPDEWEEKLENYMNSYKFSNSLDGYIKKYGVEKGTNKWNERKEKRKISNSLIGYIKKYGEEEGLKKWNEKSKKHSYRISKQYYIDTYGEQLGEILCRENSLYYKLIKKYGEEWFKNFLIEKSERAIKNKIGCEEWFINKYGKRKGKEKWNNYIEKQRYAHTINYFIEKYGEVEGEIKFKKHRKRLIDNFINSKNGVSSVSQELFFKLKDELGLINCKFHRYNKEFYIYDEYCSKLFYYDFFNEGKIIEFQGDFWHMNPIKYKGSDINKMSKNTAKEIWEYDKMKQQKAKDNGYKILIIWESEYYTNKLNIINKCIKFLKS